MSIDRIGKFQILGTLGTGAHSTILHVRRSDDSRQYALKVVPIAGKDDAKYLEQARHEHRVAALVDHPNLIKVYALEVHRDWLFRARKVHLLLEYVNGKTLDTIRGLSVPRLVQVFAKVAAALVHLHRRGVCHADLKPNNILLSRAGEVKVIDFGLAWIRGESKGRVQGTPEYMAPEQGRNRMVNERTDLYNFGATMYRLLTWRLPPNSQTSGDGVPMDAKLFENLLQPVREFNPTAPQALCDLVLRCLSFQALKRPERAAEVQGVIDRLAADLVRSPEDRLEAMDW